MKIYYPEATKNTFDLVIMVIVILIAININPLIDNLVKSNPILQLLVTITASIFSYKALIFLFWITIKHSKFLFKLYWGKFYLNGIWCYKYKIKGKDDSYYYGIWNIKQDFDGITIKGCGYTNDFKEIRTRLSSVTDLIQNNLYFDIILSKTDVSQPDKEYYAKSSISFMENQNKPPKKFHTTTYIYGGKHVEETHNTIFYKIEDINSEEDAIEFIKNKNNNNVKHEDILWFFDDDNNKSR